MEEGSSRGSLKRPFVEDDDSNKPPAEKRVRFPKGKKLKKEDLSNSYGGDIFSKKDARSAARDRAMRRNKMAANIDDDDNDFAPDVQKAEVQYGDDSAFVEEGVTIEPFNLDKEREEGYFDENGNYVEYVNRDEIKDAWLDNVDVDPKYTGKISTATSDEEKPRELATEDLAGINRRIANVLEPGETVLKALRRLKGNSSQKKQKMSPETKRLFDQLTEDAMKLMENGDYNVYEEKQESFEREAEGYERLVRARKQALPESSVQDKPEDFDIFADDDASGAGNLSSDRTSLVAAQPTESGEQQNDFAYDESSGYYYSSSLGYYYDPSSGLYCSAASGKWYSYNEELATYDEVGQDTTATATNS